MTIDLNGMRNGLAPPHGRRSGFRFGILSQTFECGGKVVKPA